MDIFNNVAAFLKERETEIHGLWETLVNIDSGSHDIEGVDRAAACMHGFYTRHNIPCRLVERDNSGNGVVAEFCAGAKGKPAIFVGHYDTVWEPGTTAKRPFTVRDGMAYGPGVFDMKGGIVMLSYVGLALERCGFNDRPIRVVLAGDEEIMHEYSNQAAILDEQSRGCCAAFCFEGCYPDPKHPIARKGVITLSMTISGVPAHAGKNPEDGRSAVLEATHKIQAMEALTDFASHATVTVGTIQGGTYPNTTPDSCTLGIDVRGIDELQMEQLVERIQAIAAHNTVAGTSAVVERKGTMPPMANLPGHNAFLALSQRCSRELGLPEPVGILTGGASDAAYASRVGVPVLDHMGVRGNYLHTEREYAIVASLMERMLLTTKCVLNLHEIEPYSA